MNHETAKIALICPVVFREPLITAISKNRYSCFDYSYSTLPRNKLLRRIIGKVGILFEIFSFFSFNKKINNLFSNQKNENYDVILIIHGHFISRRNKKLLSEMKSRNIVLWTTDSLVRHKNQRGILPYVHKAYFHDGNDAVKDNETWLPFGYDDEIFKRKDLAKEIDILFIGNIYPKVYRKRLRYLKILSKSEITRKYRCVYVGQVSGFINSFIFSLLCKKIEKFGKIESQRLSDTINSSKICINIQQDDGFLTVNPMFFAIPACGSCMLAEDLNYFSKWLTPDKDFISVTESSIIGKINNLFEDKTKIDLISSSANISSTKNSLANCIKLIIQDSTKSISL